MRVTYRKDLSGEIDLRKPGRIATKNGVRPTPTRERKERSSTSSVTMRVPSRETHSTTVANNLDVHLFKEVIVITALQDVTEDTVNDDCFSSTLPND
jgi:hypothetical protein